MYVIIFCLFLYGCSTTHQCIPDVDLILNHYYIKHSDCNLHNTYRWQKLPDKIDKWQYRIYAPYIQNCYKEIKN